MTTMKNLVKQVLMSTLTAGIFSFGLVFTACSDELEIEEAPKAPMVTHTRAAASNYNINEHSVIYGSGKQTSQPFNMQDWESESAIFCYVGGSGDNNIFSESGDRLSGFTLVNLPWSDNASSCNFLGFYNKYTGVLRLFVYVPQKINAQGSTHLWGIQLNDLLASRSVFRYGVPTNKSITTRQAKEALGQSDDMSQVISPWKAGNFSGFSGTPLNPGWWAFDVDLSVYRKENSFLSANSCDNILTVQPLSKTDASLKMESDMLAKIEGTMELKATQANTESGIFAPIEDLLGKANAVSELVELAQSVVTTNPLKAIENGVKLAKGACNLAGIDHGQATTGFDGYKGNVNMTMNGTINSNGIITNVENVAGFSPISFKLQNFLSANCPTFGEGIWNLAQSPVVYYTDATVNWIFAHTYDETCESVDIKSPFGGKLDNITASAAPYRGQVCYFDPTSIKLELNPNLFTQDEIKNAKVYATCGVRKNMTFGSTEMYRNAMGLGKSQYSVGSAYTFSNRPFDEAPFNALSSKKDNSEMNTKTKFAVETIGGKKYGLFGCGDAEYLLEPQTLFGKDAAALMPAYEVTVTVVVTHNGKPIIYSRTYLPEYKEMKIVNMPEITDAYISSHIPANYHADIFSQQMNHIKDIYNWTRRTLHPTDGTPCHLVLEYQDAKNHLHDYNTTNWSTKEVYATLFDNDLSNRWVSPYENVYLEKPDWPCDPIIKVSATSVSQSPVWKGKPCWFVEFETFLPGNPTSYTLISANDAARFPQCSPRVWGLYGKKNKDDDWTPLAGSSWNNQPEDMLPKESSQPTRNLPFRFHDAKSMKYYRFEVYRDHTTNGLMRLGEIRFNYDD